MVYMKEMGLVILGIQKIGRIWNEMKLYDILDVVLRELNTIK